MSRPSDVARHYGRAELGEAILAALRELGKDVDHLTPDDLAPVDEFHTRGRAATLDLARLAQVKESDQVLDVGSGLGGPSRFLAHTYRCHVTGVDLTAEFCAVARLLAERTGLSDRVAYRQGDALQLPFPDRSFDLVWSQNAAMNIADRRRLYREMRRVLKPGGRIALNDILAGPGGEPHYPVPWARDKSISFLCNEEETRLNFAESGLRLIAWQDTSAGALEHLRRRAAAAPSSLGIHLIFGEDWPAIARNQQRNLVEDRLRSMNALLERAD